jgi:hypothetical protein
MKKIYYAPAVVILILIFTNPTLRDFKEHLGITTSTLDSRFFPYREYNYFICSSYSVGGSGGSYFGIAGNFFYIKNKKQISEELLQKIYNRLSCKLELGDYENFKQQLKDIQFEKAVYTETIKVMDVGNYKKFDDDIKSAIN